VVPLRDNNPTKITPYVNYGIIAVNILVFIYQLSLSPQELQEFFRSAAVVPCQLSNTCPVIPDRAIPEWLTLITSQFLHGGFLHIAGNMLFLWVFGNNIEDRLVISNFCFFI
jgi:membrane associated rhomboid family serine protease